MADWSTRRAACRLRRPTSSLRPDRATARGPRSRRDYGFPAEFSSCIGVDRGGYETPFDDAFRSRTPIEFVARGEAVVAPARGGGYTTVTGTSFATPAICGLCALLLGAYPELKLFEIKTILRHVAKGWASS